MFGRLVDAIYALGDEPSLQHIKEELNEKLGNEVSNFFRMVEEEKFYAAIAQGVQNASMG